MLARAELWARPVAHIAEKTHAAPHAFQCLVENAYDWPQRKRVFDEAGYFVSPSERAQVHRAIKPLEIIISAMWIASGGFLGSP
jgi:hypothetical protein